MDRDGLGDEHPMLTYTSKKCEKQIFTKRKKHKNVRLTRLHGQHGKHSIMVVCTTNATPNTKDKKFGTLDKEKLNFKQDLTNAN